MMKRVLALLVALMMAAMLMLPAMAEATEDVGTAVEQTAEAAGDAVEETAEAAEDVAETAAEAVEEAAEAAEDAAEDAEEAAEETRKVSPVFKKLLEQKWYTWVVVIALVVAGVIMALSSKRTRWNSRRIAMAAMSIAIAFVLSCIRLYRMPQGGSITPASMLPLVMFMLACGPLQGFVAGCAYGLLQLLADPWVIHPVQLLVDYPLAYGAMILGCLAAVIPVKKRFKLPLAVLLAAIGRYAMAVLSGTVFFAEYAGDQNALVYSLVYNISYLGPDTVVCMIVALIPGMSALVDMIRKSR